MGLKSQIVDRGPRLLAETGPRTALRRGPVDRGPRGRGLWTAEPLGFRLKPGVSERLPG